ncbi:hypothetical protein FORC47_p174 (plasmid) [Bacillus cereus]|nr:hypothetical protein FORC47_p174 [Bacillus cereus]
MLFVWVLDISEVVHVMKQKECSHCYSMQEANFPAIVSHPELYGS